MSKARLAKHALVLSMVGAPAFAEVDLEQEWVNAMNACEALISNQTFDEFQGFKVGPSIFNTVPRLEKGFWHPILSLNVIAASDGSEWFLYVVTGDTGDEDGSEGAVIGTLVGTLLAQIRDQGNIPMVFEDGKTFAPVRVICHGGGRLTSVFAYYGDESRLQVAAVNRLPVGTNNPCL